MKQEIILEGIHAMLEEIRDNLKRNPEVETIKSKLNAIEKACNEFAEKKLVTEDLMASFISYMLKRMIGMDKKQDEKIEKLQEDVLRHHKFVKEKIIKLNYILSIIFSCLENLLKNRVERFNILQIIVKKIFMFICKYK